MLIAEICRICRTERTTNFKIGTPMEHALSIILPLLALRVCEIGFLHAGGGITCQAHPAAAKIVQSKLR